MKYFIYIIISIVSIAIIAGFFVVGSPKEERLRRLDETRIGDLQNLQFNIVDYWQNKNKLPEKLSDLENPLRGIIVPKDPETNTDYDYTIKGPLVFALCANFALTNSQEDNGADIARPYPYYEKTPFGSVNWEHSAGQTCFERTIDKDFFKPIR